MNEYLMNKRLNVKANIILKDIFVFVNVFSSEINF